jgi:4-amino-4-deoxy-L-arabinose transferase-like glycosyltransferase
MARTKPLLDIPHSPEAAPAQPTASAAARPHVRSTVAWTVLRWLVPLAFLQGLMFVVLLPPWQHYDEPSHFEYGRKIASGGEPLTTATWTQITHEIAASMYQHRFWPPDYRPPLESTEPIRLGFTQTVHPPFYYQVIAAPIRLTLAFPVETQLYAARGFSLLLYVLVIVIAWRIGTLVMPQRPDLHLALPLLVILTPAFSDIMTAVNNDVLVNFCAAVMLLACVHLVRDGIRPMPVILALASLAVGVLTKRTAVIIIIPLILALLWALHRKPFRWQLLLGLGLGAALLATVAIFEWRAVPPDAAARASIGLRSWVLELDQRYLRLSLETTIQSILDIQNSGYLYQFLITVALPSFWMRFAWGHVAMGPVWENVMLGLVIASAAGLLLSAMRRSPEQSLWYRRIIWLCLASVSVAWLAMTIRLHVDAGYIPSGRYLHIVLIPTIWLLIIGFQGTLPTRWQPHGLLVLVGFFAVLNSVAWMGTIINFYYR